MATPNLTPERLRELLHYNEATGIFTRRIAIGRHDRHRVGEVVGTIRPDGYWQIGVDSYHYLAHRLVWLYITGNWPVKQIDHINGNRSDNCACNLREATNTENQHNQSKPHHSNKSSGYLGVSWNKNAKAWHAAIRVQGRKKFLGYFNEESAACIAYLEAKAKYHPFAAISPSANR